MRLKKQPKTINEITHWFCRKCDEWIPESHYYNDKRTPNGLTAHCKKCHMEISIKTRNPDNKRKLNREYMRRARVKNHDKFKKRDRERSRKQPKTLEIKCRSLLNKAVKSGALTRPKKCSLCNRDELKIHAHHENYYKPLDVIWLCTECHADKHRLGL